MSLSIWQILLVAVLFILLFGRGRIPALMGDVAEGIRSFKKGMAEEQPKPEPAAINTVTSDPVPPTPLPATAVATTAPHTDKPSPGSV